MLASKIILFTLFAPSVTALASAQGCPFAHSHPVRREDMTIVCKCDAGYENDGDNCVKKRPIVNPNPESPADICALAPKAQEEFIRLRAEITVDEQVIRNFGFEQTSEQIEHWGQLGEEARKFYQENARDALRKVAVKACVLGASALAVHLEPARARQLSEKLETLLQRVGVPSGDELYSIARKVGTKVSAEETEKLVKAIERVNKIYEAQDAGVKVALADTNLEILKSVVELAALIKPEMHLLSMDLNTLSLAVYATDYELDKNQVEMLTTLTQEQLKDLQLRAARLRNDVSSLNQQRRTLESAKAEGCDSTKLAK